MPHLRILVIHDEPLSLRAVVQCLEHLNQKDVEWASNGTDGLRAALRKSYDLILCDVHSTGMNAPALHQALAERRPAQAERMAFITGGAADAATEAFFVTTHLPILPKPFLPVQLHTLLLQSAPGT